MDKVISLIQPSRNNLRYLKWSYESIRKYASSDIEYCVASDYSNDGTVEWCEEISKKDKNFKYIVNNGTWFGENKGELDRMGHCRLYDKLILEVSTKPIFVILHADMHISENFIENMYKHLKPGVIVSGTRIEPGIHPEDMAKIQKDFGLEPNEFDDGEFQKFVKEVSEDRTTEGFFAPWMAYKDDFQSIGGHDQKTFGYQSREDTDIAVRFILNGYKLVQSWDSLCYHLTMRGSRRNPKLTNVMNDSNEWLSHNKKSERNYIRKWGNFPKHDETMKPVVLPKYNVGFKALNCTTNILKELEPWCSDIYGDWIGHKGYGVNGYIKDEQPNTQFDLKKKIHSLHIEPKNDVVVEFDCNHLTPQNFQILVNLSDILKESGEVGEMKLEIFKFNIKKLDTYERELINVK